MMRPVKNLKANKIEYIGSFEQVYMNICIDGEEAYEGVSKFTFHLNLNLVPLYVCVLLITSIIFSDNP